MNNDRATIETPIHGSSWPMTGRNRSSAPSVPTTTISSAASTCRRRKVPCSARRAALTSHAIDVPSVRIRTTSHAQPKSAAGSGPVATSVGEIVWSIDDGRAEHDVRDVREDDEPLLPLRRMPFGCDQEREVERRRDRECRGELADDVRDRDRLG